MLVGTDVCVRMVFVWEETGVPDLVTTWPSHMPTRVLNPVAVLEAFHLHMCLHFPTKPNFIFKDLPWVLIALIADQIIPFVDKYKYKWCSCKGLPLTVQINLSESCLVLPEIFWIYLKMD